MSAITAWARASVEGDRRPRSVGHFLIKRRGDRRVSVLCDQQLQPLVKLFRPIGFAALTRCRVAPHKSFEPGGEFVHCVSSLASSAFRSLAPIAAGWRLARAEGCACQG